MVAPSNTQFDSEYEKIFQVITSVVFGRKIAGHSDYEKWLSENVCEIAYGKSVLSGEPVYLPLSFEFYGAIKHNIVTIDEGYGIEGKKQLSEAELNQLNFQNSKSTLRKLATVAPLTVYGENSKMADCSFYYNSHSCYKSVALNKSKYSLYSFWPRQSDYMLGCYYTFSSQFCIKCYNSENLTRCFEMSDCTNCTDSLFCHNCENLSNCMFCFNVKAKKYAIANVEVGKEKYLEIRKKVLEELTSRLEKEKRLDLNIFNLNLQTTSKGI